MCSIPSAVCTQNKITSCLEFLFRNSLYEEMILKMMDTGNIEELILKVYLMNHVNFTTVPKPREFFHLPKRYTARTEVRFFLH